MEKVKKKCHSLITLISNFSFEFFSQFKLQFENGKSPINVASLILLKLYNSFM